MRQCEHGIEATAIRMRAERDATVEEHRPLEFLERNRRLAEAASLPDAADEASIRIVDQALDAQWQIADRLQSAMLVDPM